MFKLETVNGMNDEGKLEYMNILLKGQVSSEKDSIAILSNASAIIMSCVDRLNWSGFYIMRNGVLVLGPFQGLPACNRIEIGSGVCGTAVEEKRVLRVDDVHQFSGHIACDSASQSELVLPIIKKGRVYGVLDLDSPEKSRFTELEEKYFLKFVTILIDHVDWETV
ncbi:MULTISPECIES: GAF domain-containing protein [Tissierellales]|jgi:GAF domain-containing protein|uniref:GAF domain-containing protein n=1 Tax=Acidilutibacter cellobiosedens TaxID=2507161 RepID=A0A410QB32_9FIRM|nr:MULTISPECIES: GAF domain-containing protein [Tissierellales]MBE6082526.1 GAF domain-containing protein [Tissierellaceae bacterium]QAT61195.1 GAF domain-containing protein [Acidilutibacter cellobiosedens]SCL93618.1 Free methionine-R-sulfoxide reductase [Sporanaerobacter sp. PP17-6a]